MARVKELHYSLRRNIPLPEDSYQHIHIEVGETVLLESGDDDREEYRLMRRRVRKKLAAEIESVKGLE